jgi:diguanylate cyclase
VLLAATAALLHYRYPGRYDPMVDIATLLMTSVTLPATSVLAVMLASMRSRLRMQRAELLVAVERIRELATRDELTGLANRRHAQQLMQLEFSGVHRTHKGFSVAMIDLDHFKRINDWCGHGGGDKVLQRFAEEASGAMRAGDVVCRWGGEEFLIFMPGTNATNARRVVERLRQQVEALRVATPEGEARFTFSAGIAQHLPPESVSKMISRADAALYRAKAQGRNRVMLEECTEPG